MKYYLALDGGGSKTVCILFNNYLKIVGYGSSGVGNYQIVGLETALKNIDEAIERAKGSANFQQVITSACFSLAGINSSIDYKKMLKKIVERHYASKIRIVHDGEASLHFATLGKKGIIVILGTGSLVAGYDEKGNYYRSCNWGHLLGDEGSAYRISSRILSLILRGFDGRIAMPIIGYELARYLKIESFDEISTHVHTDWQVKDVAKLAPFIISRAAKDMQIYRILQEEANEIAIGVKAISEKVRSKEIFLTGGLVNSARNKIYIDLVKEAIASKIKDCKIKIIKGSSLLGSALIALKEDNVLVNKNTLSLLKKEYKHVQKELERLAIIS